MADDAAPFPYLRWAKAHLRFGERLNLGLSGAPHPAAGEVEGLLDPTATWPDPAGALREALGDRYGVGAEQVHLASGTSQANFACFLAFARGGRVVSETPTYEAFLRLGQAVGASTATFRRDRHRGWRIDAEALRRAVTPDTSLITLTDLHNPSGAALHPDDMNLVLEVAERADARVLVDEVYLDLDPGERSSAAHLSPRVLVTGSLTKAHGLWYLRCGWVLGAPDAIREIDRWNDLVCPALPLLSMSQALTFLPHAHERLEVVRAACDRLTRQVDQWVASRDDVAWVKPQGGFTGFLLLGRRGHPIDGDAFAERAWAEEQVRVVPGSYFQRPDGVRISYLLETDALADALEGLGRVLDRTRQPSSSA